MTPVQKIGVFTVGLSILLTAGYGAFSSYSNSKQVKAKNKLEAEINRSLPSGSSPDDVLAYLDQKSLEHSPYIPAQRMVSAIQRETSNSLLITGDVQVVFYFDKSDKLARVNFRDTYTGP